MVSLHNLIAVEQPVTVFRESVRIRSVAADCGRACRGGVRFRSLCGRHGAYCRVGRA